MSSDSKAKNGTSKQTARSDVDKGTPATVVGSSGATEPPADNPNDQPIETRMSEFIVLSRLKPQFRPAAFAGIEGNLRNLPGVKFKRRIHRAGVGATALGGDGADGFVFEATPQKAAELKQTATHDLIVEHNARLRHYGVLDSHFAALQPMLAATSLASTSVGVRVTDPAGNPISRVSVTVYGRGYPQQATTDGSGLATVSVFGGEDSASFLYVKPFANYEERWIVKPALSFASVNTVVLQPIELGDNGSPFLGWGQRIMNLDRMIDSGLAGKGARVAIIDSGCDIRHPALAHITKGYDFTNEDDEGAKTSWTNDTIGHGSHCAGIIAGKAPSNGLRGFVPEAEIHILKLFEGGKFDALMSALAYAIREGMDVVNCSLGSEELSEAVAVRMQQAREAGVAVVVAAGNSGGPVEFPARLPSVLAVSAIGKRGTYPVDSYHAQTVPTPAIQGLNAGTEDLFAANFTCFGPEVRVCGPGVAIVSSVPGGGYASWDGTSMAAPHITGLAALVAAHDPVFADPAAPRNAERVDRLFQRVIQITRLIGMAQNYAGAGLPVCGGLNVINGRFVTDSIPQETGAGSVPLELEDIIRAIVAASIKSIESLRNR
jgi:subtilisin family serine protease